MTGKFRRLLAALGAMLWAGAPTARGGTVVERAWDDVLDGRPVRVYLPPGYDAGGDAYPVLYLFDGQNLFDEATSFAGEWHVDETCDRLIADGRMRPLVVVGVDNGGTRRLDEYTPWAADAPTLGGDGSDEPERAGGGGGRHLAAIVRALKPRIDAEYRTRPGPDDTGIGGSSLGGLMTLYAACEWPRVFGRFAALSPSVHWAERRIVHELEARRPLDIRLYADMGGLEQRRMVDRDANGVDDSLDDFRALADVLRRRISAPEGNLLLLEDPEGIHHESAWARRLPDALEFLFPGPAAAR